MADEAYRRSQEERLQEPHIAPFTALVDQLRAENPGKFIPYVAPASAGARSRVLALHVSPSPEVDPANGGSGFLSVENDDSSAERHHDLLVGAGLDPSIVLPWNAVPYVLPEDSPMTLADTKAGRIAVARVIRLLPRLRSVVIHGRAAEPVWKAYLAAIALPAGVRVEPITFSTGDQAVSQQRVSRMRRLASTYESVAEALR